MCIVYIEWPNLIHLGVSRNYFLVILVSTVGGRGLRSTRASYSVLHTQKITEIWKIYPIQKSFDSEFESESVPK